ncbi:MMPL family transporter [Yinghuangia sp. ASG 101]|uniref:MMPL family transporter n=1 Tax=Yinghuangia sp. ASG 101 TaxID=2896848 RepID=UPI001E520D45|nr:MMPL family transporter [Yinghuangia sp. ASG 101]UGQ13436.1 MMPL family transporter [Yinghuangia sp. ASG 101]
MPAPQPTRPAPPGTTRLGGILRRAKWSVLIAWIAVAIAATALASDLGAVQRDDAAAYLPQGVDSTTVARLAEPDPDHPDAETAIVVYHRDGAPLAAGDAAVVDDDRRRAAWLAPGEAVTSEDGRAAMFVVRVQPRTADDDTAKQAVRDLRDAVDHPRPDGLDVLVTGEAALGTDSSGGDVDAVLLVTSMAIVALLLLLTYRSPVLWLLPLLAALITVMTARGAAYGLARAGSAVTELSSAIQIVLVFGVATDYAMLLLHRYRSELAVHADRHEAMAHALRRTTPAILASAGTVIAGMLALLAADLAGLRGLGPVAAVGVVIAAAAMLTLFPALLLCVGRRALWPRIPRPDAPHRPRDARGWAAVARHVTRRPVAFAVLVTAGLGIAALGLTNLRVSADPLDKVPPSAESVAGHKVLAAHFAEGVAEPLRIVLPEGADETARDAARTAVAAVPHIAGVAPGEPVSGRPTLDAVLDVDPYGDAADRVIGEVRDALGTAVDGALVGGTPAVQADYRQAALQDTWRVAVLVLLAITVILGVLLRSVVAPLVLVAATVLSFAGSLGLSTLLFTQVIGTDAVAADLFLYVFVFLVAVGVDYTIFLTERIREERRRLPHAKAVRVGVTATGGVITAAGLVLAGTFGALAQLPDVTVAQVGVAVATGVLIDTLLVRSLQIPAVAALLGDRFWWPSRRAAESPPRPHGDLSGKRSPAPPTSTRL